MHSLPVLTKGDIVDVIAPSRKPPVSSLRLAARFLRSWGLVPRIDERIYHQASLFTKSDADRLAQVKQAFSRDDSKAIWCIRGGYGCIRLMPDLVDFTPDAPPKFLIGFSDITLLHLWATRFLDWPCIHAPVLEQAALGYSRKSSLQMLKNILFGNTPSLAYRSLTPLNEPAKTLTQLEAPLRGGNLSLIHSSIATPWELDSNGAIIFVEDIDERGYRIDATLAHLRYAGLLDKPPAFIIGDFTGDDEPDGNRPTTSAVIRAFAASAHFPVYRYRNIGHNSANQPLLLNRMHRLMKQQNGKFILQTDI